MQILPDVPRLPSVRNKVADCVFAILSLCSRIFLVVGAVTGAMLHGFVGFFIGLIAGAIIGFWMRRSLGLKGKNLTHGYHSRMYERGLGGGPRLLEGLLEAVRGDRLAMTQCRGIASAYAEAARQLQSCGSAQERAIILAKRHRQVLEIVYGEQAGAANGPRVEQTNQVSEPAA
jgi:hypothetical protein